MPLNFFCRGSVPNRILRDGINSSDRIDKLSFGAEILYRRLMSVADDYGRFYASPATVRGACWPTAPEKVKEQDVSRWISECAQGDRPLIRLYQSNGRQFLEITDFGQQVRSKSKFPEYDISLQSGCEQVATQLHSTSRSRISESESKTETVSTSSAEPAKTAGSTAKEWEESDLWLKSFLETQTLANLPQAHRQALLNPEFWERTSEACGGIDLALLQAEFAKMGNWLTDNPSRKPTPRGIRRFVSGWLERAYERERRYGNQKQKEFHD